MSDWVWIDQELAIAVHEQLLVRHGGLSGVRDLGLLQSALARPRQFEIYGDGTDGIALAAAYTAEIIKNHPFADGNKRTGFVAGVLFLELNGMIFTASEEAATTAVLLLASGQSDESVYQAILRANYRRPAE